VSAAILGGCASGSSGTEEVRADQTEAATQDNGTETASNDAGNDTASGADDSPNQEAPAPPPDLGFLDEDLQKMVEFEAIWQCDLARYAVSDLSDIDALRAERRAQFGVTDESYAAFQDQLSADAALRQAVADQTASCIDSGESVQL
jgi:hypothetical protein